MSITWPNGTVQEWKDVKVKVGTYMAKGDGLNQRWVSVLARFVSLNDLPTTIPAAPGFEPQLGGKEDLDVPRVHARAPKEPSLDASSDTLGV